MHQPLLKFPANAHARLAGGAIRCRLASFFTSAAGSDVASSKWDPLLATPVQRRLALFEDRASAINRSRSIGSSIR
jgi:hypothetical protein